MAANELRERPVTSGVKKVAATGMGSLMPVQTAPFSVTSMHFSTQGESCSKALDLMLCIVLLRFASTLWHASQG